MKNSTNLIKIYNLRGNKGMSTEHLKEILKQEEHADKIRLDALTESKRIVSMATEEATTMIEAVKFKADAMYKETIERANNDAANDFENTLAKADVDCSALLSMADKNLEKAISVIVREVVN